MYDLAIIGGGPGGVSAGVYAARKRLKTIFIAESIGGQSTDSVEIQNWIGTPKISGLDLAKSLEEHLRAYAGDVVDIEVGTRATKVTKQGATFVIETAKGNYEARAVLVATGGSRRKLDVPGAIEFENKGVTYCASCDGPMFTGQDVVVVGGGNAGFETAAQLLAYCKSVTLLHRSTDFTRADAATVEAVLAHENMRALTNTEPIAIEGKTFVDTVVIKDKVTGSETRLPATGVFVEVGMSANTGLVSGLVELDNWGRIKVDGKNQRSSLVGLWSAGDCSDGLYHQNNIAAGDAVKALEDIYFYVKAHSK
jgi:thioredoxin reductase